MSSSAQISAATGASSRAGRPDALDQVVNLAKAVGDRLRAGILQVLHQDSYAVGELCELFEVPQPALSHHLKILHQAGLVARRREGNSVFYHRAEPDPMAGALLAGLDARPVSTGVARRIEQIHLRRTERSAEFFERNADQITAHQAEICAPGTYQDVVLNMIDSSNARRRQVLEVGPGAGTLLAQLAERFDAATGVDNARSMLLAAQSALTQSALKGNSDVRLRYQDFMTLTPCRLFDAVVAAMVIHHQASPAAFFKQAARLIAPCGFLLVAELCRHDQEWARSACGDQWLGFEPDELAGWADAAGFRAAQSQYLAQKNGFRVQVHRFERGAGTSASDTDNTSTNIDWTIT